MTINGDINHTAPAFQCIRAQNNEVERDCSLRENRRSNCSRIIRFTVAAFLTDYVEEHFSCVVAVVAQNPHLKNTKQILFFQFVNKFAADKTGRCG